MINIDSCPLSEISYYILGNFFGLLPSLSPIVVIRHNHPVQRCGMRNFCIKQPCVYLLSLFCYLWKEGSVSAVHHHPSPVCMRESWPLQSSVAIYLPLVILSMFGASVHLLIFRQVRTSHRYISCLCELWLGMYIKEICSRPLVCSAYSLMPEISINFGKPPSI